MGQNLVPLVNIKIAGKWMFIPLKMVSIGIDPFPFNHHFNQRVNSPLLWGTLGGGTLWFPWCIHNVPVNIAATPGMVLEIHLIYIFILYIYISYYIALYHIISYYIILCIYKSNSLQHVCCTEYLIMYIYIYNCIYIYVYSYIFVYIYIHTIHELLRQYFVLISYIYIYIYLFIYLFILHRRAFWLGCSFSRTGGVTVGWQGRASNHIVAGMWFWS